MQVSRSTVDPADIQRFENLGEEWWNPRGSMRVLHEFNPQRVEWIRKIASERLVSVASAAPLAGLTILDIGCGGGILSEALARLGATVTGIDPAEGNVRIASAHAEKSGLSIEYRAVTAEELEASGTAFDIVCAMEVVEHVTDLALFTAAAAALTRPGGLLFAATLNRTLKSFALGIVGAEYVLGWVPKGTHQWEKFVTPAELEEALDNSGMALLERTGVVLDPLRRKWRWSRDMAINYMMAAQRIA